MATKSKRRVAKNKRPPRGTRITSRLLNPTVEWGEDLTTGALEISNGHEDMLPYASFFREDVVELKSFLADSRRSVCTFEVSGVPLISVEKAGRFVLFVLNERKGFGWTDTCDRVVAVPATVVKARIAKVDPEELRSRADAAR